VSANIEHPSHLLAHEPSSVKPYSSGSVSDDDIDLRELLRILWLGKFVIITVTILSALVAVVYALTLPNLYRAEALILPTSGEQGGIKNALVSQFGGLASLAGVNLSSGGSDAAKALAILESRQFLERFIERHNILVPLMATQWKPLSRNFAIDSTIFNEDEQRWVRKVSGSKTSEPTAWEAVNAFRNNLSVYQDKKTTLVTIAFEWYKPEQAAEWINALVGDINGELRRHDRQEAERAVAYLKKQLEKTHLVDMQQVFYQLIEAQMKTVMLTDARNDYAFQVIDPAVAPEMKSSPKRALICILGTIFGGLLGVLVVLAHSLFIKKGVRGPI